MPIYLSDIIEVLEKAMMEGYVSLNNIKLVICGPPAVGKTAFKDLLLNKPPPLEHHSTPIAARPVQAIQSGISVGSNAWEEVTEDDLLEMLYDAIEKKTMTHEEPPLPPCEAASSKFNQEENATPIEPSPKDTTAPVASLPTAQASKAATPQTTSVATTSQPTNNDTTPQKTSKATTPQPTIEANTTPSEVDKLPEKLRKLIANTRKSKGSQSQELLKATWIHFLDGGGLPQFTDLLHMLVRDQSLYIIIMKATESLYDDINRTQVSTLTNLQVIENFARTVAAASKIDKHIAIAIVVTHCDCKHLKETLQEKEEILRHTLSGFLDYFVVFDSNKLILTVNNLCVDDREKISAEIRNRVTPGVTFSIKIPVQWYAFNLIMKKEASKDPKTHGIISLQSCYNVGHKLDMNEDDVANCLKYLNSMRLCIYYQNVLPQVIFTNPQFLIECLSRVSFINYLQPLNEVGVIDKSLLDNLKLTFIHDLFSKSNLLLLLRHLKVISKIKAADNVPPQYFMPKLLLPENFIIVEKDFLLIHFKERIFPKVSHVLHMSLSFLYLQVLLSMMVVSLLNRKKEPYFFWDHNFLGPYIFYIQHLALFSLYSEDLTGSIFLCEDYESIKVFLNVSRKHYFVLRKVILEALEASAKTLGYNKEQMKVSAIVVNWRKMFLPSKPVFSIDSSDEKSDTHDSAISTTTIPFRKYMYH